MKKILLSFVSILLLSFLNINAQSLAGVKICVNPGHGGHDSNDRFISETGFWESDGNLGKGLKLREILEGLGATVVMTRTENKTSDDLPLSQIVAIANAQNVDYFQSIHSNASGGTRNANYTLILFQGRDNAPTYPGSLTMGNYLADEIFKSNRTTYKTVRGDFDFYGTGQPYLGVFKGLNMPGTLSEGSFHDYVPESFRLKNTSYLHHEAWAIARSFLKYFNAGEFQTGIIAGLVRSNFEGVDPSYLPIVSKGDNYKPLNQIKVTLQPGGEVYNGDDFNNGFYSFENIQPGEYKLFFEAENYALDSSIVTVTANQSKFADKKLGLIPNYDPPNVVNISPADGTLGASNISNIIIEFDIRMNTESVQNVFSISPAVSGTFSWENLNKRLIFTPSDSYSAGTEYTVSVTADAKSHFDVNLAEGKTFKFTTREKLILLSTYPDSGAVDIATTVFIKLIFDEGVKANTLAGKISLTDINDNALGVTVDQSRYSEGIIGFEPKIPLQINSVYRINIKEGIGDIENVLLKENYTIEFKTALGKEVSGNFLEGFENTGVWIDPVSAPNSTGINLTNTKFSISTKRKYSGVSCGRLDYEFSGSGGLLELGLSNNIDLGENTDKTFGIWVFGDNSRNVLEYWFARSSNSEISFVDTIDWTGWDFKEINLNVLSGSGAVQFAGIAVRQNDSGDSSGLLYFDDVISEADIVTDVKEIDDKLPSEFAVDQNYPNPFNPSTIIRFSIPSEEFVQIKVYNTIGQEVAELLNEQKSPGTYEINFNAGNLSSGIYFYKISAGNFVRTKKMLLLK